MKEQTHNFLAGALMGFLFGILIGVLIMGGLNQVPCPT